jgi:hypothetical protein
MFNPGDWVTHLYDGSVGYVTDVSIMQQRANVKFIHNKGPTSFFAVHFSNLKSAPVEAYYSPTQIDFLINLALDTNDKEWFLELTEKRDLIGQA